MDDAEVMVVGAVNADFVAAVGRRPAGGETVLAAAMRRRCGGKGANQAAAAARAGAVTAFVGAVGDDPTGAEQIAELSRLGVDVSNVRVCAGVETGMAFVTVTPEGENSIVVAAGANGELRAGDVVAAMASVSAGTVVVAQTEIGASVIDAVAVLCLRRGARFVVNTGPSLRLAPETLAAADPIVANEHEARDLCGVADGATDGLEPGNLARAVLAATRARSVVVTLGAAGALIATPTMHAAVPAVPARVVDTTGAGDAFVGSLAARLSRCADLVEAAQAAAAAAAEAVTWHGARPARTAQTGPATPTMPTAPSTTSAPVAVPAKEIR